MNMLRKCNYIINIPENIYQKLFLTFVSHRYQHKKKCTEFYLSQSRMKEWDFLSKTPFEFCRYFQYEQNYAQFTVSLIRDFLYCNYSITMGVNKELILSGFRVCQIQICPELGEKRLSYPHILFFFFVSSN